MNRRAAAFGIALALAFAIAAAAAPRSARADDFEACQSLLTLIHRTKHEFHRKYSGWPKTDSDPGFEGYDPIVRRLMASKAIPEDKKAAAKKFALGVGARVAEGTRDITQFFTTQVDDHRPLAERLASWEQEVRGLIGDFHKANLMIDDLDSHRSLEENRIDPHPSEAHTLAKAAVRAAILADNESVLVDVAQRVSSLCAGAGQPASGATPAGAAPAGTAPAAAPSSPPASSTPPASTEPPAEPPGDSGPPPEPAPPTGATGAPGG